MNVRNMNDTQKITLDKLKVIIDQTEEDQYKGFYVDSYPSILSFFEHQKPLNKESLIQGICLVYSWMPTIPKKVTAQINHEQVKLFNNANDGYDFDFNELNELKGVVNNSIVGLSKLLHFINPDVYPIWDSKIGRVFGLNPYQINRIENYMKYHLVIDRAKKDRIILDKLKGLFPSELYELTTIRKIDMVLFSFSAKISS